ncbi:hypothetical protein Tco_1403383 [Tanacetum coccineum]
MALYHDLMESILVMKMLDKGVTDIHMKRNANDVIEMKTLCSEPDHRVEEKEGPGQRLPNNQRGLVRWKESSKGTIHIASQSLLASLLKQTRQCLRLKILSATRIWEKTWIVPADYFFNNDLAYLQGGSTERTYTTSLTKMKDAKYDLQGIEDMVPILWSPIKVAYNKHVALGTSHLGPKRQTFYGYATNRVSKYDVYSIKRILEVTKLKVNKWYGYGHLQEIKVPRSYQQLYTFMEGDFPRLHLNDIEDMLLLVVQTRLFNLKGKDIVHLAVALRMFTRRIVIQKRVEDLQLRVKSYQKIINISRPLTHKATIIDQKPYTTYSNPQGVIYLDKLERNRLMCSHELYKLSDGTLISVWDKLKDMAKNLKMGYNSVMPRRR